jgi:transposase
MRGKAEQQAMILSAVTPDQLVSQDHPIREIKPIVDRALAELSPTFNQMYAQVGRPSIPPEHLLKGCLLIALYSIRSERQFCERLQYDLLFKWFLDLNIMDPAFDPSTFSKNKARLLEHQVSRQFFTAVLAEARRRQLLSEDHLTVDGTLLEAWASLKAFAPGMARDHLQAVVVEIREWTFVGRSAAMTPMPLPPTRRPGWPARGQVRRPNSVLRDMC